MQNTLSLLKKQKILYVEDEKEIRDEMSEILEFKSKELITATNGQEGFELYNIHKPDIIITDIRMPILDGIGMISKIREFDKEVPVVIVSAFDNNDFLKESIELHVDKYVIKPIDINILIKSLEKISYELYQKFELQRKTKEIERIQTLLSRAVLYTTSDLKGNITFVSEAFEKFTGYTKDELIGKNHSIFRISQTPSEIYKNMWHSLQRDEEFTTELQNHNKQGEFYWIKITIFPIFDENNKKVGYGSYREDITDKKMLEHISTHDELTKIYNRAFFQKELTKKIKSYNRYSLVFGLILLDIDFFKKINDNYGHQMGDEVLKKLTYCIGENIREDDIFARWGGEEFVIIANNADEKSLIGLLEKLQKKISQVQFGIESRVTLSFGVTLSKDGDDEDKIIKRADDALYKAKQNGRDCYNFVK
ncbi:MAG: diguanylate cyclase [Campylobacterales bacterium]|nr:diguanylate cyclase [Campylobacterales bacterium]